MCDYNRDSCLYYSHTYLFTPKKCAESLWERVGWGMWGFGGGSIKLTVSSA